MRKIVPELRPPVNLSPKGVRAILLMQQQIMLNQEHTAALIEHYHNKQG